jgi:hypothetical protein
MNGQCTAASGHYEITVYQHSGEITAENIKEVPGHGLWGQFMRDGRRIWLVSELAEGDWYWEINEDGSIPAGPFLSRGAAIEHARSFIEDRRLRGDKVLSIMVMP